MSHLPRRLAGYLLPPVWHDWCKIAFHRVLRDDIIFTGDYRTWERAASAATGYSDPEILERVRSAILAVKTGKAVFERDSVLLSAPEYSYPALTGLLWVAGQHNGRLDVVDFGGSLGSSYFQFRRFLEWVQPLRWAVVEQPHFVQCGSNEISEAGLSFHPDIPSALGTFRRDIVFLSGVLQYLPDPHAFIETLIGFGFDYILIDRTAFHDDVLDRLTLQVIPSAIYRASYPAWFFNEERFLEKLCQAYTPVYSFDGRDRALLIGGRSYYRGYLLRRNSLR